MSDTDTSLPAPTAGQVLIYRDGALNLQVRLDGQTVWLTQRHLADLYQTTVPNISQHLTAIYGECELAAEATVKRYLIVQTEGTRQVSRTVEHYSLDVILAVGYRVRSPRGTLFTTWKNAPHGPIRKADVTTAKNYLAKEEIEALNLIVSAYLDFAELHARGHRPMHMADWIAKLDAFLKLSERDILTHAGNVSHEMAVAHAQAQFEVYEQQRRALEAAEPSSDFDKALRRLAAQAQRTDTPPSRRRRKPGGVQPDPEGEV